METNPAFQRSLAHSQPGQETPQEAPKRRFFSPRASLLMGPIILFPTLLAGFFAYFSLYYQRQLKITDFDSCSTAPGSLIQESYPETCLTQDGRSFTHILFPDEQAQLNPSPDPVANWQTHSNNILGFQLKFPQDHNKFKETEKYWNDLGANIPDSFISSFGYPPPEQIEGLRLESDDYDKRHSLPTFGLWAFKNPESLTPKQWKEKYTYYPYTWGDPGTININDIVVSGFNGLEFTVQVSTKVKYILVPKNETMYLFSLTLARDEATQILSTFKFTD